MKKIIVAAKSDNDVIGAGNKLVWHLPADLNFFTNLIKGKYLLTGRKSLESDQGEEIFTDPTRVIVLSRQKDYKSDKAVVKHSIQDALSWAEAKEVEELFILGGGKIYEQTIAVCDQLIITEVHAVFEGETFFPKIDENIWKESSRRDFGKDSENLYDYSFVTYQRKDQ